MVGKETVGVNSNEGFKDRLLILEVKGFTKQMLHIYQEWNCLFLLLLLRILNYRAHQSMDQSFTTPPLSSAKNRTLVLKVKQRMPRFKQRKTKLEKAGSDWL